MRLAGLHHRARNTKAQSVKLPIWVPCHWGHNIACRLTPNPVYQTGRTHCAALDGGRGGAGGRLLIGHRQRVYAAEDDAIRLPWRRS
jgi:hypothetical protein